MKILAPGHKRFYRHCVCDYSMYIWVIPR